MFSLFTNIVCIVALGLGVFGLLCHRSGNHGKPLLLQTLDTEISRAERAGRVVGFMLVQIPVPISGKLLAALPGETLAIQTFKKTLRRTDLVRKLSGSVYSVLLTEISDVSGPDVVKQRLLDKSRENNWAEIKIGIAAFPRNGKSAEALYEAAETDGDIQATRWISKNRFF